MRHVRGRSDPEGASRRWLTHTADLEAATDLDQGLQGRLRGMASDEGSELPFRVEREEELLLARSGEELTVLVGHERRAVLRVGRGRFVLSFSPRIGEDPAIGELHPSSGFSVLVDDAAPELGKLGVDCAGEENESERGEESVRHRFGS